MRLVYCSIVAPGHLRGDGVSRRNGRREGGRLNVCARPGHREGSHRQFELKEPMHAEHPKRRVPALVTRRDRLRHAIAMRVPIRRRSPRLRSAASGPGLVHYGSSLIGFVEVTSSRRFGGHRADVKARRGQARRRLCDARKLIAGSALDQRPNFALSSSSSGSTCSVLSSHDEYEPGPSIT